MILHLSTSLPAGLLAVFQSVPAIRHRAVLYYCIASYAAVTLAVIGNIGVVLLADIAGGGDLTTQTFVGFVAIATAAAFGLAVYKISPSAA
ncbi:hypothetical protein F4801DRAFT_556252 [Xylaria longipes]|nr:hypothetical protein F4801DRAFT_556252 [Xylaria longipes]RYC60253.1 hypothetical protein CHU98_g5958 [Xylaria longipes]